MGWGTPCRACPKPNTTEFDVLCPYGIGMTHSGNDIKYDFCIYQVSSRQYTRKYVARSLSLQNTSFLSLYFVFIGAY